MPNRSLSQTVLLIGVAAFTFSLHSQSVTIYKAKKIYIADTAFQIVDAIAVDEDKIIAKGSFDNLRYAYPKAEVVNFRNKYIYPGFIDAHCHFLAYAKGLKECNLTGTKSPSDIIKTLKKFDKNNNRTWIIGRGWDQNDWKNKEYPDMEILDRAFPDKPVYLKRIDGHAVWINSAAMKILKFDPAQKIDGGEFVFKNGKFSGILIDNAIDIISPQVPEMPAELLEAAVKQAAGNCHAVGLTTLDEAGLDIADIEFLKKMQFEKRLHMRFYAMLSANEKNFSWISERGIEKTPGMHVGAVKFYMDGALGSRGALLKHDYCDRIGHKGLMLTKSNDFFSQSYFLYTRGFQVCTHAIGDSAQKIVLETYRKILPQGIDLRWRVEHAQITDPADFNLYKSYGIIPSVQPTHATSDAPWAQNRICEARMEGAYAYETLRKHAGMVALGTDFPVEDISPIKTFYSAVTRKDAGGNLKEPFIERQMLSRQHALWGMTYWAAYSNFEEKIKGTLEAGKYADFVVTGKDIMTVAAEKIPKTKIRATYIAGKQVYKK